MLLLGRRTHFGEKGNRNEEMWREKKVIVICPQCMLTLLNLLIGRYQYKLYCITCMDLSKENNSVRDAIKICLMSLM